MRKYSRPNTAVALQAYHPGCSTDRPATPAVYRPPTTKTFLTLLLPSSRSSFPPVFPSASTTGPSSSNLQSATPVPLYACVCVSLREGVRLCVYAATGQPSRVSTHSRYVLSPPASYLSASVCVSLWRYFSLLSSSAHPCFRGRVYLRGVWPTHAMMLLVPRTPYLLPQRRPVG